MGLPRTGPLDYREVDWNGRVVLVLGSEGRGLRPRVAGACDALVAVPLRGRIESLSVGGGGGRPAYAAAGGEASLTRASALDRRA